MTEQRWFVHYDALSPDSAPTHCVCGLYSAGEAIDKRLEIAETLANVNICIDADFQIKHDHISFDPLTMPISRE